MKKFTTVMAFALFGAMTALCSCGNSKTAQAAETEEVQTDTIPTVYYIKNITPENIVKVYEALGREAKGNKVGIKISTRVKQIKSSRHSPHRRFRASGKRHIYRV